MNKYRKWCKWLISEVHKLRYLNRGYIVVLEQNRSIRKLFEAENLELTRENTRLKKENEEQTKMNKYRKWLKATIKHARELRVGAMQDYAEIKGLEAENTRLKKEIEGLKNCLNCKHVYHEDGYYQCDENSSDDPFDLDTCENWRADNERS